MFCLGTILFVTSCIDRDESLYIKVPKEQYFDFSVSQKVALDIDYGFKNKDYVVLFEIYDQNPLEEENDGTINKKEIEPIYRAATDGNGKFTGNIEMLSVLSEVWLYSEYLGTVSPVKLEIKNNSIVFNQSSYIQEFRNKSSNTRATTSNQRVYPTGWLVLGDWDKYGTPDYLLPELATPPSLTLYRIQDTYSTVGSRYIPKRYPQLVTGVGTSDIKIIKPTKIYLSFISSGASWNSTVGYFTYPTNNPPTSPSQVKKVIAFPNASPVVKNVNTRGALLCGDQVQLKYWDGTEFKDEFPAGVSIGWFLEGMSFDLNTGKITEKANTCRYSLPDLNSDKVQRTVSLRDTDSDQIVSVGFEDSSDFNYTDATFYVSVEQKDAIDSDLPSLPDVTPPANMDNYSTFEGTLTYEDLWPEWGDYDMNDVMIDYNCKVYKTIIGNKIYKLVDEFTVRHNGGTLQTGFGYQFDKLVASDIRSIKIEGRTVSSYMEGQSMEPGQSHPNILLFDDVQQVVGEKFIITVELNDVDQSALTPPYNPYIFVGTGSERGKEVHLPKYLPTDKADISLFGTGSDRSRPEEQLYYVGMWIFQMPFALNMAGVKQFPIPKERVRIDQAYPDFQKWVNSGGASNKDWYNKPAK